MTPSRRGFLGLFTAGATVAPLIAGKVIESATARLIEEPKVEIIAPPQLEIPSAGALMDAFCNRRVVSMRVEFSDLATGESSVMVCKTVIVKVEQQMVDVTECGDITRRMLAGGSRATWSLEGVILGDPRLHYQKGRS